MERSNKIRLLIREMINKVFDEERIPNPEADEFIKNRENFLGSHTYGEDIGGLGKMYAAYSYGEQHPLYVWIDKEEFKELRPHEAQNMEEGIGEDDRMHLYNEEKIERDDDGWKGKKSDDGGMWFDNESPYYVKDRKGRLKKNKWTEKHMEDLKPNEKAQARDTRYLHNLIVDFKRKYDIGDNIHTDLKPGEK